MLVFFGLLVLALGASADTVYAPACNQNITLVDKFVQQPYNMSGNSDICYYRFKVPAGSYAQIRFEATNIGYNDDIVIEGQQGIDDLTTHCDYQFCPPINASTQYPEDFLIAITAGNSSRLVFKFVIGLQKMNSQVVGSATTMENVQPSLLYFNQWKEGTSYTFNSTSTVGRISIQVATEQNTHDNLDFIMNNVFLYDGTNAPRTLNSVARRGYISQSSQITLCLVKPIYIRGAVLITDYSNLKTIGNYYVQYVPLSDSSHTGYGSVIGDFVNPTNWGAISIVGESDGSTPIDVRQLNTNGGGGSFRYSAGGPLANIQQTATPVGNRQLPLHLTGNLNTFYITQGTGSLRYTISQ